MGKTIVLHLLNIVVYEYWEKFSYGCQINHPNQKHRVCGGSPIFIYLFFRASRFDQLAKRLWTDCFIQAIQRLLTSKTVKVFVVDMFGLRKKMVLPCGGGVGGGIHTMDRWVKVWTKQVKALTQRVLSMTFTQGHSALVVADVGAADIEC